MSKEELDQLLNTVNLREHNRKSKALETPRVIEAARWLKRYLAFGPKSANDVFQKAGEQGYSRTIIKRAKSHLNVYSRLGYNTTTGRNQWMWFHSVQNQRND